MREYTDKDYEYLSKSLLDAGFTKNQMSFETDYTFITDDGFFSYKIECEYPRLIHFYLNKDKRDSLKAARRLIRTFVNMVREKGCLFYIVESPKELPYMKKWIHFIKGKKYYEANGDSYYYVPVFGRFK